MHHVRTLAGLEHTPVVLSHVPTLWHWSEALHVGQVGGVMADEKPGQIMRTAAAMAASSWAEAAVAMLS